MFGVANHTLKILNDLHSNVQYTYIYMIQWTDHEHAVYECVFADIPAP